ASCTRSAATCGRCQGSARTRPRPASTSTTTARWSGYRDRVSSFLDEPVRGFLDQLAARTPTPGGGGAAAVHGAIAAGLVAMAARFCASRIAGAGELEDEGEELRRRLAQLADMDARVYAAVLEALRLPREASKREVQRQEALLGAALVPLEIAGIGARVAL